MSKQLVTIKQILDLDTTPSKKISELVELTYAALGEAETLADEHGESFSFGDRLGYGMGGTYGEAWDASSDEEGNIEYTWNASSQSC